MPARIPINREKIADFCKRNEIRSLALFGSVLRSDFGPESDVDVLVDFQPQAVVGCFRLHDIEQDLSTLLGGRRPDIVSRGFLNPRLRDRVLAEAETQYEEG